MYSADEAAFLSRYEWEAWRGDERCKKEPKLQITKEYNMQPAKRLSNLPPYLFARTDKLAEVLAD